ncbi:hypothetical protein T4D_6534 [Trichinella pseudospiralis]|uniref:Uncharacterized protein n=1 Tax=Trichinella pseudospiralis TaxID=6337 RepID=A0A0V1C3F5_TRIPS|nr:hypothetical protein T4D_6534 [Trichinella pseudospiralis]
MTKKIFSKYGLFLIAISLYALIIPFWKMLVF